MINLLTYIATLSALLVGAEAETAGERRAARAELRAVILADSTSVIVAEQFARRPLTTNQRYALTLIVDEFYFRHLRDFRGEPEAARLRRERHLRAGASRGMIRAKLTGQ